MPTCNRIERTRIRYLLPLAELGVDAVGLDLDSRALTVFERRAAERGADVCAIAQDFLEPDVEKSIPEGAFDIALIAGSTLIMMTPDSQELLLEQARSAVRVGESVVVKTHNREYIDWIHGSAPTSRIDLGCAYEKPVTEEPRWVRGENVWYRSYQFMRNGEGAQSRETAFVLPPKDVIRMAQRSGLALSRVTSGWSDERPRSDSPTLVYLFQSTDSQLSVQTIQSAEEQS